MRVGRYYPMKTPFIWISHQIQHVKKSNNDAGRLYFQERFSLNNVSGLPLVDLDLMTRVEITCPMNFNWFPFDSQVCKIALPSQYLLIFFELSNTVSVSDNKIQITILILRRGALSKVCHFVIHSVEFYDVTLVNILGENQLKQLEQQNIVLNYNVKLRKLPQDRLLYETHEVRIRILVRFTKTNICRYLNQI